MEPGKENASDGKRRRLSLGSKKLPSPAAPAAPASPARPDHGVGLKPRALSTDPTPEGMVDLRPFRRDVPPAPPGAPLQSLCPSIEVLYDAIAPMPQRPVGEVLPGVGLGIPSDVAQMLASLLPRSDPCRPKEPASPKPSSLAIQQKAAVASPDEEESGDDGSSNYGGE